MSAFPLVHRVRQTFDHPVVLDIEDEVRRQILGSRLKAKIKPDATVAVAVGSRGVANLRAIVAATMRTLQAMGAKPFVVAGMGTHGGGTAEGQRRILSDYGVTEDAIGAPIRTEMDSVQIGVNEQGAEVYWDRNALAADLVVAINRVKAHTDFTGPIESGILKMIVIGLGKKESAKQAHRAGSKAMATMVPASARVVLANTRFALGLAIVENAADQTALLRAIEPEDLFEIEPQLLRQSKAWMGKLPFAAADVLIVGELGKNYSGTGMDPNVLGRRLVEGEEDFPTPRITRLAVLDMAEESHGNSIGVGFADLTTQRLIDRIDQHVVRLNTFTAQLLLRGKIPFTMANDKEVFEAALATCWQPDPNRLRLAIVPNTLELSELYVTSTLAGELQAEGGRLEIGDPTPLPWTSDDRLDQCKLFPHSNQGRRTNDGRNGSSH